MMDEITETDRIERDLAQTRARMDSRLDALQEHLTPKQMLNDAFAYFRGGEGAGFTSDLVARAKANPIPVALTGIGIAWLMASSGQARSSPRMTGSDDLEARLRRAEGEVRRFDDDDEQSYSGRLEDARAKVVGVTRDVSDTAASYADRIKDSIAAATTTVRRTAHNLTSSASDALGLGTSAKGGTTNSQQGNQTMAFSARDTLSTVAGNPFALGGIAALVGLVAGALIPTLDQEEAALGSVATKLKTTGRDLAQDVVDRGGRIASGTLEAVKGSAEAHGLTADKPVGEVIGDARSGALVDSVKQVAQETLQAGKDAAQTHLAGDGGQNTELQAPAPQNA